MIAAIVARTRCLMRHGITLEHAFGESCEHHRATADVRRGASEALGLATNPCRTCVDLTGRVCPDCGRQIWGVDDHRELPVLPNSPALESVFDADNGEDWIHLACVVTAGDHRYGVHVAVDFGWAGGVVVESTLTWIQSPHETIDVECSVHWKPECIADLAHELAGRRVANAS